MVSGSRGSDGARRSRTGPDIKVSGSRPPSRQPSRGNSAPATPKIPQRDDVTPISALTHLLVKKMKEIFGEAAADAKAQEAIAQEVQRFVAITRGVREEDLGNLEERIRRRLTGDTPVRNGLVLEKQAADLGDEWAKIWKYNAHQGSIEDGKRKDALKRAQRLFKADLDAQVRAQEELRQAEKAEDRAYAEAEAEALRLWEAEMEGKRCKKAGEIEKLKSDRQAQLQDVRRRREEALARKKEEEEILIAKIAHDTRSQMEEELNRRQRAKEALCKFLASNEINKKIKEEERQKEMELDQRYMQEYAAMLDHQEATRHIQLEKLKAIQARQEEDAKERPPAKRWIDPSIIEKHFKAREDALDEEEKRRAQAIVRSNAQLKAVLDQQIQEKQKRKVEVKKVDDEHAMAYVQQGKAQEELEASKKRAELQKKVKIKLELEAQMRANALHRRAQPMSDTERLLNADLLKRISELEQTGSTST